MVIVSVCKKAVKKLSKFENDLLQELHLLD
jgi:hypothetical protein